jgi:hypothetical protein
VKDEQIIQKFLTDKRHITVGDCGRLLTASGYILHKRRAVTGFIIRKVLFPLLGCP